MPQQVFIESRNQTIEFPDDATQEEIDSFVAAEFPRTGKDVAYDLSKFSDVADMRDFIAMMPDEDYVKLNNYRADEKLSWGELAGIAGEALGTIVGDAVKGVGSAVTRVGDGVMESAARGVGAGTIDLVNLGQKLITPNKRIPSLEEFLKQTKDQPIETIVDESSPFGRKQIPNTQEDYKALIDRQRFEELQSLAMAEASEKLIKGAPIEEVARGASYLDAMTLAGLGKNIAKAGLKTIFKKTAQAPIEIVAKASPEMVAKVGPEIIDNAAKATIESRQSFIPANMMRNAEAFAQKVGEGAKKAGFTGVELGAKAVEKTADLGKGIINVANKLGLENAALRGTIGGAIGYQDGGTSGAITGTVIGSAAPVIARKGLGLVSGTADFIGAAAKAAKTGPSRVGIFEKMAQAADISPEARKVAERLLFAQPFVQAGAEAARKAAGSAVIGVPVGAALGYATDGERGAAAGAGAGLAISALTGPIEASIDSIKAIAGKSTARSQRNAMGDIRSFVNNIPDDVARTGYAEFMDKAIQVAGPERAADMLDHLRLAEGMGATVEVVPPSKRKNAFNAFDYKGQGGGKIIINPDRLTPGSVAHETFHQLLHVGVKAELEQALRNVYMPQRDADGNIIKQGLFDDAEFAKKASELAELYKDNPKGYDMALDYANKLKDPAGVSPEALDQARMFVIDEMTAEYSENFMGRGRPGVFNPDRLPLWHRNLLRQIDDKILNTITDKIYADKNIKGPNTPFFTDENGKPVRVPQLDKVLNRAFANKMARDRGQTAGKMGRPSEVVIPTKPRDLVAFAQATFGATRDILGTDEKGNPYVLTDKERKATTAADFEAAKEAFQSLPQEAKATVQVTNKTGQPVDINSKSAQIRITQQTPNDVFEAFLRVAKERGMGNQQIANMRQIYQAITAEEGPTFNTVNNPVYKFNARTGGMRAEVRPPTRQEVYPLGIRINSAGGFNVDYIDMSRVKANAQKILDNPNYKGIWDGIADFMGDFKRSLKNLSDQNAIPSAELLGKGNEKIGAVKRDLIAEAMNVTLPKRLEYTNQPVIDPLTLLTSEGKERRVGGSAIRDFRIERLTEVIPTDERMKVVQENFYDRLVSRFQPSAFVREALPNGETLTNPDGYRILKKTGGKLFRVYDDNGALLGTSSSEDAAMKKAQSDYAKKVEKESKKPSIIEAPPVVREFADGYKLTQPGLIRFQPVRAYHGTPHKVDKFTTDKIGTGEGAQAYGWGLYFAKARAVAEEYRKTLSTTITVGGKQLLKNNQKITSTGDSYVDNLLIAHDGDLESAIASERVYADSMAAQSKQSRKTATGDPYEILNKLIALQQKQSVEVQTTGNLYTVELLPDEADFLDWDKPLSEQSEKVKAALYSAYEARGVDTQQENFGWQSGQMAYKAMMDEGARKEQRKLPPSKRNNGSLEKQASEYLASLGIPGIRYLDGQSRGSGEGTHNYVIFDENLVKIIEENGKPVGESPAIKRFQPVTPEQDAAFLRAAQAGDTATTQKMVDEAAKKAGYVVKAHAGHRAGITVYDPTRKTPFFSKSKAVAESYVDVYGDDDGRGEMDVKNVYLKLGKSLIVDFEGKSWMSHPKTGVDADTIAFGADRDGYDSVTFLNIVDDARSTTDRALPPSDEYAIFKPDLIKSADPITYDDAGNIIPLSQRFNVESPDIRFQPDSASPSILNGSNGTRIIKSPSGKFRIYSATGALLGIRDTEEAAKKLATK